MAQMIVLWIEHLLCTQPAQVQSLNSIWFLKLTRSDPGSKPSISSGTTGGGPSKIILKYSEQKKLLVYTNDKQTNSNIYTYILISGTCDYNKLHGKDHYLR